MPNKCLLILLDGIGDRSYAELDHQTPLQAAATPFLDGIAREGASGLYHAANIGQALPSETAHFALFGYSLEGFPGRGALEALGAGIHLCDADVAMLAHFVSLVAADGVLVLRQGKPEFTTAEAKTLFEAVYQFSLGGTRVRFVQTHGLNGIVTLRGDVSPAVTDTDPFIDGQPLTAVTPLAGFEKDRQARQVAAVLNDYLIWAHKSLDAHPLNRKRRKAGRRPINGIVTQRSGQLKQVPPFFDRFGLKGLSIASGIVYMGLAAYVGMDATRVADTDRPGKDLSERIRMAGEALADYDFIHVHTKAPDAAAHTKDPLAKKKAIESLDAGLAESLPPLLEDEDVLIVVASDHSTPSRGPLIHSGEAVPVLFHGACVRRDDTDGYDEVKAAAGALGPLRGPEVMYMILNCLDRAKLQGIMDTPVDQPFWPGRYEPFTIG